MAVMNSRQSAVGRGLFLCLLASYCLLPIALRAQFLGQTSPVTTIETALNAVAVAGASANVRNVGQSVHYLTYTTGGTVRQLSIQLEGSADGTNFVRISETATNTTSGAIYAAVYYPFVRANLTQLSGTTPTVTAIYTGSTSSAGTPVGIFNTSGISQKPLAIALAADTNATFVADLPPLGTGGTIYFLYSDALCAGSTIAVSAGPDTSHLDSILPSSNIAAVNTVQVFRLTFQAASVAQVTYTSGCAAATTFDLIYQFGGANLGNVDINNFPLLPTHENPFICDESRVVALSASGNTQIIPLGDGQQVRICHLSLAFQAVVDVRLTQGTGTNCATGNTNLTGLYENVGTMDLNWDTGGLRAGASNAVCVNLGAAITGGGVVTYAQF